MICVLSLFSFRRFLVIQSQCSRPSARSHPNAKLLACWCIVEYHWHMRGWGIQIHWQRQTVQTRTIATGLGLEQTTVECQRVGIRCQTNTVCRRLAVYSLAGMMWSSWVPFSWCQTLWVFAVAERHGRHSRMPHSDQAAQVVLPAVDRQQQICPTALKQVLSQCCDGVRRPTVNVRLSVPLDTQWYWRQVLAGNRLYSHWQPKTKKQNTSSQTRNTKDKQKRLTYECFNRLSLW